MYGRPTSDYAYPRPPPQHGAFQPNDERSHTAHGYAYPPHPSSIYRHPQELDSTYFPSPPQAPQPAIYGPPLSQQPTPVAHQRSVHAAPTFLDDPAFSHDPYANPLTHYPAFAMNSREEIVPVAPTQSYSASIQSRASVHERDLSAIYAPPRPIPPDAFPSTQTPPTHHLHPPSLHHHTSAESYQSRAPSDGSEYTHSSHSHNSFYARDPHMSDASSIRLAYDEPERPVVPPEPSPHSRRSFYDNDYPVTHSHSSGSGMGSKKKLQKSRPPPLRDDHKSGGNASYTSSKSSSASSFARSQSGDPPLSARSKSSLHVVNPSPEDEAQQPYTTFNPRHSYHSSTSSISSSDEPHTPPSAHGHFDHTSSYSSSRSREEKGYLDDKRLKEKDKAVGDLNHTEQVAAEAPPAYTALPTPTEAVTAAGPIRRADSKIEYSSSANQVQVTLTPEGMYLDPLEPSTSYASSNSGRSHSSGRKVAGPSTSSMSADVPRPALQANSSAPELHASPPRDIPARSTTVAVPPSSASTAASMANTTSSSEAAPPVKKTRSRKHSAATPPGNLDKIDELDETDPLGLGWHNSGPYDAIPKVSKAKKAAAAHGEGRGAKIFAAQAGMDPHHGARMHPSHRANVPLDPATTSFAVKPGQIFPPILAPQPYMRPDAMPMSSQAPFSPPQRHAFMNAHMQPSAARGDDIPPLFSPTPSEMARAREPPADRRTSVVVQPEANWSGVGTPYASSQSEGHHSSSTSGSSVSGHSAPRGAAPPAQQYPMPQQPPPPQHHFLHRPQPNPVQTSGPQMQQTAAAPQLKPQSSRTTLSRSHSAPHTPHTPTAPLLSSDPPPTPDIQLPPPSTHAPSVRTQGSAAAALPPNPRYMPRQLVMPTPLQHARPAPSAPAPQQSFGSAAASLNGGGAPLKHSASVPVRRAQAQEIPMSRGSNVLRKGGAGGAPSAGGAREERGAGGAAAVWAGRVVVVPEEAKKKEKGGLGAFLFGGGAKEKEREREREKERVMMERARETKERERGKKLSKARR